jgi:5-methylcytosine-specific restriction endonuclease McrA
MRSSQHAWRLAHPDYMRAYWLAHLDEAHAAQLTYRLAHPDRTRAYRLAHRDEKLAELHRRRARILGNGGSHTPQEWRDKVSLFAGCCVYCGETKKLTRDHRIPLTRGGTDYITNIVPACLTCNASKGKRTDVEFITARLANA